MTFLLCDAPGEFDVVFQNGDAVLPNTVSCKFATCTRLDVRGAVCMRAKMLATPDYDACRSGRARTDLDHFLLYKLVSM